MKPFVNVRSVLLVASLISVVAIGCRDSMPPDPNNNNNNNNPADSTLPTGWSNLNPGSRLDLLAVRYAGDETFDVVGMNGTILHSTNDGSSWSAQSSGTNENLYDISYQGNIGVAVGNNATILRTTDRGATWSPVTTNVIAPFHNLRALRSVTSNGSIYFFAVGGWSGNDGIGITSSDGGLTWTRMTFGTYRDSTGNDPITMNGIGNGLYGLKVFSPSSWEVSGLDGNRALFARTDDGGLTWNTQLIPEIGSTLVFAEDYNSHGDGVAVGANGCLYERNAKPVWNLVNHLGTSDLRAVEFVSDDEVYVAGADNSFYHSTDAGATWTHIDLPGSTTWNGIGYKNANEVLVAGNAGNLLRYVK